LRGAGAALLPLALFPAQCLVLEEPGGPLPAEHRPPDTADSATGNRPGVHQHECDFRGGHCGPESRKTARLACAGSAANRQRNGPTAAAADHEAADLSVVVADRV